jgi:PPOX class probable F420-dependent enzyme
MQSMSENEWGEFVMQSSRTGKLATVRADGRPHLVPIWFMLDQGSLVFMTGETTVKAGNIYRGRRVAVCVDDESFPFSYVTVEGEAEVLDPDPDELVEISTEIAKRYVGEERAEEYGKRNAVPGELLIRVIPTKIITVKNVAD